MLESVEDVSYPPSYSFSENYGRFRIGFKSSGVARAEIVSAAITMRSRACIFLSIFLVALAYGVDGTLRYAYHPKATSEFHDHALLSTVNVVRGVIAVVVQVSNFGSALISPELTSVISLAQPRSLTSSAAMRYSTLLSSSMSLVLSSYASSNRFAHGHRNNHRSIQQRYRCTCPGRGAVPNWLHTHCPDLGSHHCRHYLIEVPGVSLHWQTRAQMFKCR